MRCLLGVGDIPPGSASWGGAEGVECFLFLERPTLGADGRWTVNWGCARRREETKVPP